LLPQPTRRVLTLDVTIPEAGRAKIRDNFSAIVLAGEHLWLGGDEGTMIDRMTVDSANNFSQHKRTNLGTFFPLVSKPNGEVSEVDIEGLHFDGGYLWFVGSHSLKRKKPEADKTAEKNRERLGKIEAERNRHTFARLPVDAAGNLAKSVGALTAARLDGDAVGDQLTHSLRADKDYLDIFCAVPSKENGIDIEGLAVTGTRTFVGMRGPVLRGWAVILEFAWKDAGAGLLVIDGKIKKHFLQLDGLGVRELAIEGKDLYILAGPTMDLDGPVYIYRWRKALENTTEALVWQKDLERVLAVPFGQGTSAGRDHAEGISLIAKSGGPLSVMICYDSPADARLVKDHPELVAVDVFDIVGPLS